MTDNEKRLAAELAEERKLTKALAELCDDLIAQAAKEEAKIIAKGSAYYQTQTVAGKLEELFKRSNTRRAKGNLLTRNRVEKGTRTDSHDLTSRVRKAREKAERDGSVS